MRTLFLGLFLIPILSGTRIVKQNKIFDTNQRSELKPSIEKGASLSCQTITAYYNGTFRDLNYRNWRFDAELQVNIDINLKDKKIYFKVDNFSRSHAESYGFTIFVSNKNYTYCYTGQDRDCSLSFDTIPLFKIWFEPSTAEYIPDLIHIDPMTTNQFEIENAVGECGTSLKNDYPWGSNPSYYKSCFCCGEKYNPDPSLGCPVSPWK